MILQSLLLLWEMQDNIFSFDCAPARSSILFALHSHSTKNLYLTSVTQTHFCPSHIQPSILLDAPQILSVDETTCSTGGVEVESKMDLPASGFLESLLVLLTPH
jgi:hypothetical protein